MLTAAMSKPRTVRLICVHRILCEWTIPFGTAGTATWGREPCVERFSPRGAIERDELRGGWRTAEANRPETSASRKRILASQSATNAATVVAVDDGASSAMA